MCCCETASDDISSTDVRLALLPGLFELLRFCFDAAAPDSMCNDVVVGFCERRCRKLGDAPRAPAVVLFMNISAVSSRVTVIERNTDGAKVYCEKHCDNRRASKKLMQSTFPKDFPFQQ